MCAMEYPENSERRPGGGSLWLHPDDDLAPNRPGEALHGQLAALPPGSVPRLWDRLLRRPREADALRAQLAGEQAAGARLDELSAGGWRVLHSLPLPGDATLSHLAIGPGGVLCCATVSHTSARLTVDADTVTVDDGRGEPAVRRCRRNALRAAHALTRGCGVRVEVRPVLVCVGAVQVTVSPALRDVHVLRERQLAGLRGRGGVLKPHAVEAIYGVARDRRTWQDV